MKRPAFERAPSTTTATCWFALRQTQQRREAVARLRDEAGLAGAHVDVGAAEQMIRAAERDRAGGRVYTVYSGVRMIDAMRSSPDACVMSRAMS